MSLPLQSVIVLGGGSAGLLAAATLKRRIPGLQIRILRSPDIGVIGVGEGTTAMFPQYLFHELRLPPGPFFAQAQPTWKNGIRFLWGPRPEFFYTFSNQFNFRSPDLPKNNGFYCEEPLVDLDLWAALMRRDKVFPRGQDGQPDLVQHRHVAFHVENKKLVGYLEGLCAELGVAFTDGTVRQAVRKPDGDIASLEIESGEQLTADLFVDASGFRSELLGRTLGEPYRSYERSLFCDRAVIGGWQRTTEPIHPYTTCETMQAGWCWQIEHENWINRGYVYSSRFISDDAAREEFLGRNPQVTTEPRTVKFRTGRYDRLWVGNVVGIGNSSGFVEPLEATAIATIITQSRSLADILLESNLEPNPGMIRLYNQFVTEAWDEVRDFIAIHYAFNHRIDSEFWKACQADTDLVDAAPIVEFYKENGPTSVAASVLLRPANAFGMEGYLAMLVGQQVPHRKPYHPSEAERQAWRRHRQEIAAAAERGFDTHQMLQWIRGAQGKR